MADSKKPSFAAIRRALCPYLPGENSGRLNYHFAQQVTHEGSIFFFFLLMQVNLGSSRVHISQDSSEKQNILFVELYVEHNLIDICVRDCALYIQIHIPYTSSKCPKPK